MYASTITRHGQDAAGELRYSAVEADLQRLLTEFGPPNRTTPAYPFHHLVSDGVWEVRTDRGPGSPGTGVRELRTAGAAGRLAPELRAALRREPARPVPTPSPPPTVPGTPGRSSTAAPALPRPADRRLR